MTIQKSLLLTLSALALSGLCSCESTKVNSTGFDAEGNESAWDKQTDLDNAEASKLNDLEQAVGPVY